MRGEPSETIKKEFHYYRKYCLASHYNHKIKAFIYKKLYKYYENKHMKEFMKGE